MLITFLGPDGSGKTSLALAVSDHFPTVNYIYLGGNNSSRKYTFFNAFIRKNKPGKFYTFLKYLAIFLNNRVELNRSKKKHFVSDRSPIDELLFTKGIRQKIHSFFHLFYKKPDLIFLLTGDEAILYQRKKEISKEQILKYINSYSKYTLQHKLNYLTLNTTELNLEECKSIVIKEVNKLLANES